MKYNYVILSLFFLSPLHAGWQKKPNMTLKGIKELALDDEQNIWAIATFGIYKWEKNAWIKKREATEPQCISIATNNTPYVVLPNLGKGGVKIVKFDGTSWNTVFTLKEMVGPASLFVVNANDIWILKQGIELPFHWNGKAWEQKGSERLLRLGVGHDGTVMGVRQVMREREKNRTMSLVQWDGKTWKKFSTIKEFIYQLTVNNKDNVWILKDDERHGSDDIYRYKWDPKNKQWIEKTKMVGWASRLAAGRDGASWSSDADGNVYQWVEKPRMVKKLPQIATRPLSVKRALQ